MDPWTSAAADCTGGPAGGCRAVSSAAFEDSFVCGAGDSPLSDTHAVNLDDRLPDSLAYIARLEGRLASLRAGSSSCRQHHSKEVVIGRLLRADSRQLVHRGLLEEEDLALEEAVETSLLLRHLSPEQPVTRGETVQLVTADQLELQQQRQQLEEETDRQHQPQL